MIADIALAWHSLGASPIEVRADGSKAPVGKWKSFQTAPATEVELLQTFSDEVVSGIGIATGYGGVELLEFENVIAWTDWCRLMVKAGHADTLRALCDGYLAASGGGGYHLIYRTADPEPNQVLAAVDEGADVLQYVLPDGALKYTRVLIETRGVGGYGIVAGGDRRVHPTGRPYRRIHLADYLIATQMLNWRIDPDDGLVVLDSDRADRSRHRRRERHDLSPAPDHLFEVSPELREEMFALARQLDRRSPKASVIGRSRAWEGAVGQGIPGARPGEAWAAVTAWDEILQPHGWRRDYGNGESDKWTRPGKSSGTSATTDYNGSGLLYVFTTSTEFAAETSYSKFGAYALLNHSGDPEAAARDLVAKGFGDPLRTEDMTRELAVLAAATKAQIRMEANEIARRNLASRDMRIPITRTMADALAAPLPVPAQLVDGLLIGEGVTLLSAQNKAGKSTVGVNVVRAVLYGEDLFGRYATHLSDDAGVGVWNAEVSASTYERWMVEHGLDDQHAHRLAFLHMTGYPVDLMLPMWREHAVTWLREHNIKLWILDPLSKIFRGDENSATEVNAWWMAVREIMAEAEVPAAFVIHHAGHTDDDSRARARGSSAIEGDPEVVLSYRHGGKPGNFPPDNKRYLSGVGRIDNIPSVTLDYDIPTRRLFVDESSNGLQADRQISDDSTVARLVWNLLEGKDDTEWVSKQAVKDAARGMSDKKVLDALARCHARGWVEITTTANGKPDEIRRGRTQPSRTVGFQMPVEGGSR
ncbi:AAA family ATPase [Rhodococcus hoagii]|nr:AAA family ATPase [Prescottella equi]